MTVLPGRRLHISDLPAGILSLSVLLIYLVYAYVYLDYIPYAGIDVTPRSDKRGWDHDLDGYESLILTDIGPLSFEEYKAATIVPFQEYEAGDEIRLQFHDGTVLIWTFTGRTLAEQLVRAVQPISFWPFWLAGTAVLLFLRPRDTRWRLLVAFYYLTAVWIVVGSVSKWQVAYSNLLLPATTWLMAPVYLHLHLTVPVPIFARAARWFLPPFYVLTGVLAVLQFFPARQGQSSLIAFVLIVLACVGLLLIRSFKKSSPLAVRVPTRLMLAGIGFAFGPSIVAVFLPLLLGLVNPSALALAISLIAIPVLPLFYTYAIYKRQLGQLEFRVSRLLSLYSFVLIYPTAFILLFLLGNQWISSPSGRTLFILGAAIAFVLISPAIQARFQRMVDRLAYGTEHNADDIVRVFANQIPTALTRGALVQLLINEVAPSLLIRESALYLYEDSEVVLLYSQGLNPGKLSAARQDIRRLMEDVGEYRPPKAGAGEDLDWVRLVMTLRTRERTIGFWLFGRRDPDDFYPQTDINLLQTLANQIAPAIENVRLYETLQRQADVLTEQVAERTAELRAERDRTQAILDGAGEGIFFTDTKGTILYINPALSGLTGYSLEQSLGRTPRLWLGESSSSEAYEQIWLALQEGRDWSGELVSRQENGTTYDVSLTIAPCHALDGDLTGFVGILSDISRLKEVDRLKSLFVSNVSHELRTPLTNIKTYLSLLERGRTEKKQHYLAVVNKETDRLARLIEDLLQLSRLEAATVETDLGQTDLEQLIGEVLNAFAAKVDEKSISLFKDIPNELPGAVVDAGQLGQVLTNLIGNAVAYTPEGGQVTISAGTGLRESVTMLWLRVADNGPGIPPQDTPHLFERFFRGNSAQESGAPGTGLGLAICKEIITRHGGEIEVTSRLGSGAAFTVWLRMVTDYRAFYSKMQQSAGLV